MPEQNIKYLKSNDINIFSYTDYRTYLQDYISLKRATSRGFSVRQFCLRAGISTENYLLRIIRGQRNLGPKIAEKFIPLLSLKNKEINYFRAMIYANGSKTSEEKDRYLHEMEMIRRRNKNNNVIIDNSVFRNWYISAIYELASCKDFILTPKNAVIALKNKISKEEAKEAIQFLVSKKYLINSNGRLIQSDVHIRSTDGISDSIIKINHKQTLKISMDVIDAPLDTRGFYGLTIAIDKKRLPYLKEKLKNFISDLKLEFSGDSAANTVYRINANCFVLGETQYHQITCL